MKRTLLVLVLVLMLGACLLVGHAITARAAAGQALNFYSVRDIPTSAGLDIEYDAYPEGLLEDLAQHIPAEIMAIGDDFDRAVALLQWADEISPHEKGPAVWTLDPTAVYRNISAGNRGICLDWAVLYTAALQSTGARAREISALSEVYGEPEFAHVITELWLPSEQRWVVMDATGGGHWTLDGRALSAAEVHASLEEDLEFTCLRPSICDAYALETYNHVFYWERNPSIPVYLALPDTLKRNEPLSKLVKQYFKPRLVRLGEAPPGYSPRYRMAVLFIFPLLEGLAGLAALALMFLAWRRR